VVSLLDAILQARSDLARRSRRKATVLRCSPKFHYQLLQESIELERSAPGLSMSLGRFGPPGANIPDWYDPRPGIIGLTIEDDGWLPPDVWRLCADDQTLLYDCREGRRLEAIMGGTQ
jgi:hypothetical protein